MNKTKKIKSGVLFVVSAPTGGGKTTLVTKALTVLQEKFSISRIVTYTTRAQRPGETDGKDYQFVNKDEFAKLQNAEFFVETTQYHDNLYGSPKNFLDRLHQGESFIAITDRAGINSYKNVCPAAVFIWITPPSLEILAQRLSARGSESPQTLRERLQLAEAETLAEQKNPLCQEHIVNKDLAEAIKILTKIISIALD